MTPDEIYATACLLGIGFVAGWFGGRYSTAQEFVRIAQQGKSPMARGIWNALTRLSSEEDR